MEESLGVISGEQKELIDRAFHSSFESKIDSLAREIGMKAMLVVAHIQVDDGLDGRLSSDQYRQIHLQKSNEDKARALLTEVWKAKSYTTKLRFLYGVFAVCSQVLNEIDDGLEQDVSNAMIDEMTQSGRFLDRFRPLRERLNVALENMPEKILTLLVVGKTGVGKSSLVNSLLGKNVSREVYSTARGTTNVECFDAKLNDMVVKVWDTPGLWDYEVEDDGGYDFQLNRSAEYLRQIKGIGKVDLLLLCIDSMNNVAKEDSDTIDIITEAFTKNIWKYAVFVFTKVNMLRDPDPMNPDDGEHMQFIVDKLTVEYRAILTRFGSLSKEESAKLPFVPVGSDRDILLPNGCPWLPELWVTAAEKTRLGTGKAVLIEWNRSRVRASKQSAESSEGIELTQEQMKRMTKVISSIQSTWALHKAAELVGNNVKSVLAALTGGAVGIAFGTPAGPAGAVVGAACGAIVGWVVARQAASEKIA